jgi:hypothetical protein
MSLRIGLLTVLLAFSTAGHAQVRISQVFGGGQSSGSTYSNDYVELFNAGASAVDLSGYAIQYQATGSTGNWTGKITIPNGASIGAGKYFLAQTSAAGSSGIALPTPDLVSTAFGIQANNAKVALTSNSTTLSTAAGPPVVCPVGGAVVDLVGFGTANCWEGAAAAPAPSITNAIFRALGGCTDTNGNGADFTAAAAAPRNSSTPANSCGGGGGVSLSINDVSLAEGNSGTTNFLFTVSLSGPAPAGGVTFSIATADNTATTANNDYVAQSLVAQTITEGNSTYPFTVAVNGDTMIESN